MANGRVRIYNGPEQSNIIGFSASTIPERMEDLEGFMADRKYDTHRYDPEVNPQDKEVLQKLGGVSFVYLGVVPPISDDHARELGTWCAVNIDLGHNGGYLLDNRDTPSPIDSFADAGVIKSW